MTTMPVTNTRDLSVRLLLYLSICLIHFHNLFLSAHLPVGECYVDGITVVQQSSQVAHRGMYQPLTLVQCAASWPG